MGCPQMFKSTECGKECKSGNMSVPGHVKASNVSSSSDCAETSTSRRTFY